MDHEWLKGLLGIGGAVGGGLLSAEEYKRLGDIGEQSLAGVTLADGTKVPGAIGLAQDALSMSQFRPFTVSSAIPGSGFTATPTLDPTTGKITGTSTQFTLSPLEKTPARPATKSSRNRIFCCWWRGWRIRCNLRWYSFNDSWADTA
jgi:hypothetical protein